MVRVDDGGNAESGSKLSVEDRDTIDFAVGARGNTSPFTAFKAVVAGSPAGNSECADGEPDKGGFSCRRFGRNARSGGRFVQPVRALFLRENGTRYAENYYRPYFLPSRILAGSTPSTSYS